MFVFKRCQIESQLNGADGWRFENLSIQLRQNLASFEYKQMWDFFKRICTSAIKRHLQALFRGK